MSAVRARFPGRPSKNNGLRQRVSVSYQETCGSPLGHETDYSRVAAQAAANHNAFRSQFGSSGESDEEFSGFLAKDAATMKSNCQRKLHEIKEEVHLLQRKLITSSRSYNYSSGDEQQASNFSHVKENADNEQSPNTLQERKNTADFHGLESGQPNSQCLPLNSNNFRKKDDVVQPYSTSRPVNGVAKRTSDSEANNAEEYENSCSNDEVMLDEGRSHVRANRRITSEELIRSLCPVDLNDVEKHGFPIVIDTRTGSVPPKPLCFLCGSAGIGQLIFCSTCCEPFHPFCGGDDALLSSFVSRIVPKAKNIVRNSRANPIREDLSIEDMLKGPIPVYYSGLPPPSSNKSQQNNNPLGSLLSPPLTPMPFLQLEEDLEREKELEIQMILQSWTCSRCIECVICRQHGREGTEKQNEFLKCVHCRKNYHVGCLKKGVGKREFSDKWVCEDCFKCKSCGAKVDRKVPTGHCHSSKQESSSAGMSNLMLCLNCFQQRQKGSYCPVCEACYDDDDFETRMMECAMCNRWVHAKCERISEEQYQILSNLPESIEFICRLCDDSGSPFWRQAIRMEMTNGCEAVFRIFQKKTVSMYRKKRVLQPQPDVLNNKSISDESGCLKTKVVCALFNSESESKVGLLTEQFKENSIPSSSSTFDPVKEVTSVPIVDVTYRASVDKTVLVTECSRVNSPVKTSRKSPSLGTPVDFSPSKRMSSILESVSQTSDQSIFSIYKATIRSLESSTEEEESVLHLKEQFEQAVKDVFPWFSVTGIEYSSLPLHYPRNEKPGSGGRMEFLDLRNSESYSKNQDTDNPSSQAFSNLGFNPFEDIHWNEMTMVDRRQCAFCHEYGDFPPQFCGRLLWAGLNEWIHVNCALWSSEVYEDDYGALQEVGIALTRSRSLSCDVCDRNGASVGCCHLSCRKAFHFPCALNNRCALLEDKSVFCPAHVKKSKVCPQEDMQVMRQVFVNTEWLRKKEKPCSPADLRIFIGSLRVDRLGYVVPISVNKSDGRTTLVPIGYKCSRLFWSSSNPLEKVIYNFSTSVRMTRPPPNPRGQEVNIVIDHSKSSGRVRRKTSQVEAFHAWADTCPRYIDEYNEEWATPCSLSFTDPDEDTSDEEEEHDSGMGIDLKEAHDLPDSSKNADSALEVISREEVDLFGDYLTQDAMTHLHSCAQGLIGVDEEWPLDFDSEPDYSTQSSTESESDEELGKTLASIYCPEPLETEQVEEEFSISQLDGAQDEDESSSSEDRPNDASHSDSSSSDVLTTARNINTRGSTRRATAKGPMATRSRRGRPATTVPIPTKPKAGNGKKTVKKRPRSSSGSTSEDASVQIRQISTNIGSTGGSASIKVGPTLRSRERLPKLEQKQQEFKCSECKKSFPSQGSVNRHSKWCKPKKSKLNSKPKTLIDEKSASPAKRRGRSSKPKVSENPYEDTVRYKEDVLPRASTEVNGAATRSNKWKSLPVTDQRAEDRVEGREFGDGDAPVSCSRCKNTYRTEVSFKKHLSTCFYYSSSSSNGEEEASESCDGEEITCQSEAGFGVPPANERSASSESDSTTETEDSNDPESSDEAPANSIYDARQVGQGQPDPGAPYFRGLTDPPEFRSEGSEIKLKQKQLMQTPNSVHSRNQVHPPMIIQPATTNTISEIRPSSFHITPVAEPPSQDSSDIRPGNDDLKQRQLQEILTQFQNNKDFTVRLKDSHNTLQSLAQAPEVVHSAQERMDSVSVSTESTIPAPSAYSLNLEHNSPFQSSMASVEPAFGVSVQTEQDFSNSFWNGNAYQSSSSDAELQQKLLACNEQPVRAGSSELLQPLPIQHPQFQTVTLQSSTGQLVTVQIPIAQSPSLHQFSYAQQSPLKHSEIHINTYQQVQEIQLQQFQHQQIQAASIQRQLEQGGLYHRRQDEQAVGHVNLIPVQQQQQVLYQRQRQCEDAQAGANPNTFPPISMRPDSNILRQPVPSYLSPENNITYVMVQQGNTFSAVPIPYRATTNPVPVQVQPELQHCTQPAVLSRIPDLLNVVPKARTQGGYAHAQSDSCGPSSSASVHLPCTANSKRQGVNPVGGSGSSGRPCPCPDSHQRIYFGPCGRQKTKVNSGLPKYSKQLVSSNCNSPKRLKLQKARTQLGSIGSERQGQGLLLYKTMTSPSSRPLPKLLPAKASSSNISPSSSSATILPAEKNFTTNLNIAVVHPLQKMSDQVLQIDSPFTANSHSRLIPENWIHPGGTYSTVPSTGKLTQELAEIQTTSLPGSTLPGSLVEETVSGLGLQRVPPLVEEPASIPIISSPVASLRRIVQAETPPAVQTECPVPVPDMLFPGPPVTKIPCDEPFPPAQKSIKITLKRQEGADSYSLFNIIESGNQPAGTMRSLKIKGKITSGELAGNTTDVVVQPMVHTVPIPDPDADGFESSQTVVEAEEGTRSTLEPANSAPVLLRRNPVRLTHRAMIVYEVKLNETVVFRSSDVRSVWGSIFEAVQGRRLNHNLPPLAYPATNISLPENKREAAASFNQLGLAHRAVQFLLEQLPGINKAAKDSYVFKFHEPAATSVEDAPVPENESGTARSEGYAGRKPFDMFGWLASKHRTPLVIDSNGRNLDLSKGADLPVAMKFRNLSKLGVKHLNVYWSSIHGRGLFTTRDIECGDMIIEYAGEVIRSPVCDLREKYYESKGIGCYMFRIDDHYVVDATLKGNAARFINHSCEPNCRSRIMEILGQKHIVIIALRRIISGNELTYDYKFPYEDIKIPCSCGTFKCRKFLN